MNDDRRYMTWEERAHDDARYRPGGVFGRNVEDAKSKTVMCSCGKTVFIDGFGSPASDVCPQCGERA